MSEKEQNLLEKLSSPEHPFYGLIKINDDMKSIESFNGVKREIYSDSKVNYEALLRELIMQTILKDTKIFYNEEKVMENNYRTDISARNVSSLSVMHVVEFKQEKNSIEKESFLDSIGSAESQILNKYTSNMSKDAFSTTIIGDITELINNPNNLEQYFTYDKEYRKKKRVQLFKKLGIFVETKKIHNKLFMEDSWSDLPKISTLSTYKVNTPFGDNLIYKCKILEASKIPTVSNTFGIQNPREIKDINTYKAKNDLVLSIFNATIKAFPEIDKFTILGQDKTIVYVANDTIVDNVPINTKSTIMNTIIVSLNAAIVDGQNSIDALNTIHKIAIKVENNIKPNGNKEKAIHSKIKKEYDTIYDRKKFRKYLEELTVTLKFREAKDEIEAREIAISINNTMPVLKHEKDASASNERIKKIANRLIEKGCPIDYTKKERFGIPYNYLNEVKIFELLSYFLATEKVSSSMDFKQIITAIESVTRNPSIDKGLDRLVVVKDKSPEILQLEETVKLLLREIDSKKDSLGNMKRMLSFDGIDDEAFESCTAECEKLDEELDEYQEKLEKEYVNIDLLYTDSLMISSENELLLINLSSFILKIKKITQVMTSYPNMMVFLEKKESLWAWIFISCVKKYNINFIKRNKIDIEEIKNVMVLLEEFFKDIVDTGSKLTLVKRYDSPSRQILENNLN